ncbi:hypothetical protein C8Q80DRAFT_1273453 [Daedaleopsis nitida]|nr:hypothetical protein C8Q80DRAFT_1273453 [Daedaleopsis nitida]
MSSGPSTPLRWVRVQGQKQAQSGSHRFPVASPSSGSPKAAFPSRTSAFGFESVIDFTDTQSTPSLPDTPQCTSRAILSSQILPNPPLGGSSGSGHTNPTSTPQVAYRPYTDHPSTSRKRARDDVENQPPMPLHPYVPTTPGAAYGTYPDWRHPPSPVPHTFLSAWHPGTPDPFRSVTITAPTDNLSTDSERPTKRKYRRETQKLSLLLDFIYDELGWSIGDVLYALFDFGDDVHREPRHASGVACFLQGRTIHTAAEIIDLWMRHPDGRVSDDSIEHGKMFSARQEDLQNAKSVRVALTCFATQRVMKKLIKEAEDVVRPESGLHASRKKISGRLPDTPKLVWNDIGAATLSRANTIIKTYQPLLRTLLMAVAVRDFDPCNEDKTLRQRRPPELVVTNVISDLDFSRSNRANYIALARGLLHFALSAPFDIFQYQSRTGAMPAYSTVISTLEGLAKQEAERVVEHGKDTTTVKGLITDNIQHFLLQRDLCIGRVNAMKVGMAATYVELHGCPVGALDFADREQRLKENTRASLSVSRLFNLIDQEHLATVGVLFLLRTLAVNIPELAKYQDEVSLRYRTRGRKLRVEPRASNVHPLGSSGKNETVTTELKDALVDFLEQAGQEHGQWNGQLMPICGDGLTFEKIVQVKHYLRFHPDPFESLSFLVPVLAPWHTVWTDIGRIFQTHWGTTLSHDPSTLAFSAGKIHRRTPANLSKPDFKEALELLETVHDARILDCFRIYYKTDDIFDHFKALASDNKIPSFEDLETHAKAVYRAFCTHHSGERALDPVQDAASTSNEHPNTTRWKAVVPLGAAWTRAQHTTSTISDSAASATKQKAKAAKSKMSKRRNPRGRLNELEEPFTGDRVLANAINFIGDAITAREFLYAVSEGDVGRVYEAMKMMLFTFAGTRHSRYTQYLLEFISSLEFESSPALRETILKSLLVNLSGEPGRFSPADLIQEYFNRLLQAIAERKGAEYSTHFICHVVSRNLHHLARLRDDFYDGVGLAERSGRHAKPHKDAELRILLKEYKIEQLHYRRPGRTFASEDENHKFSDFRQGLANLRHGKLSKWVNESLFMRGTSKHNGIPGLTNDMPDEESDDSSGNDDDGKGWSGGMEGVGEATESAIPKLAYMRLVDGDLLVERLDVEADAQRILDSLEAGELDEILEDDTD